MAVIEDQLKVLGRVTNQALTFHREQQVPKEIDLVELAESALKLHSDKLTRHGIRVKRRYRGPAPATVFGSQILQVVSNLILNAVDALRMKKAASASASSRVDYVGAHCLRHACATRLLRKGASLQ